jgi:membrane-bound lytic murein transglycosylase B
MHRMRVGKFLASGFFAIALTSVFVLGLVPLSVHAQLSPEERAKLEAELADLEKEIAEKRGVLATTQAERTTLERDILVLDTQIEKARLSLRQRQLTLQKIEGDIQEKSSSISELSAKQQRQAAGLAELIRRTQEMDDLSLVELALGGTFSEFFVVVDQFESVQRSISTSFDEISYIKSDLAARKLTLEERQAEEEELRHIQELEKRAIEQQEAEKQQVLEVTKGEEKQYQELIAERERSASEIRTALFELRDSAAIPFGDAYDYAKAASAKTGVRPALILAILKQETNLGENVGQCLLTNSPNKGDGKGKNTGRAFDQVMKGSRDVDVFMQITAELGIDPYAQVVSCPPGYGYGGAMGPAQFIPSTWIMYKDRIGQLSGQNPPNPWTPRTAVFATAVLMMDNGADRGTWAAERLAALRYFAGWANANKAAYAFYGDDVMRLADKMQQEIDILER